MDMAGAGNNPDCKWAHFLQGFKCVSSALLSAVNWRPLTLVACVLELLESTNWVCVTGCCSVNQSKPQAAVCKNVAARVLCSFTQTSLCESSMTILPLMGL